MPRKDLAGLVFGRLTVVRFAGVGKRYRQIWRCRCSCGKELDLWAGNLQSRNTSSCGCLRNEKSGARFRAHLTTHGQSRTVIYALYRSMIARCYYKGCGGYRYYGARGIIVCRRWLGKRGFENFLADMGPRPSTVHSIERKNHDKNYTPTNCVWATAEQQAQNKRNTIRVVFDGEEMSLRRACRLHKVNYDTVLQRVWRGWDVQRALWQPIGK